ncbi:hypothetical protein BD779DRAFT_955825 [Infundibulicybe gibba]|nr:hypothetical protein BD779DRAFT_955825 [Infundibulicybe gibba]
MDYTFQRFLARYIPVKTQFPGEGRRKWRLRVLQEAWRSSNETHPAETHVQPPGSPEENDDSWDYIQEGPELGVLVRTDFSDEPAWQAVHEKLLEAEKEFADATKSDNETDGEPPGTPDVMMGGNPEDSDDSDASADGMGPAPIIKVLNVTSPSEKAALQGISNIAALRLLNDVAVRPAPSPPAGTKRITTPNKLVDCRGWQEIYSGSTIWIYDATSNTDHCVRLVNQQGDLYGTATGDSWRARVSHICELQFNMTYLGMKIDFGGMDRWDYSERQRNLVEADIDVI